MIGRKLEKEQCLKSLKRVMIRDKKGNQFIDKSQVGNKTWGMIDYLMGVHGMRFRFVFDAKSRVLR